MTENFAVTFKVSQEKVPFGSIQEDLDCPHLGGKYKEKEVKTKEAETEDPSVYDN